MKARGSFLVLVCALGAFLTLPAPAEAKPGYKVRPAGSELFATLGEKGDYEISLEANDRQRVLLAIEEGLFTALEYSTKGHVSSKRIEADFGDLGRIDIDIHLAPRQSWSYPPSKNCRGPASIEVPGTYRGTIEFSGEGDVPRASFTRGEINFIRRFKRVCKQRPPAAARGGKKGRKPKLDVGLLEVLGKIEDRTAFLGALALAPRQNPALLFGLLIAGAYERSEGVLIERSTLEFFGPESFRASKRGTRPETVRIKLPEPFAGRALYSRSAGSPPSWTGNLNVDLPGADDIPLTGFESDFKARFCRGSSVARAERCLYGSGSHSQPLALAKLSSLR